MESADQEQPRPDPEPSTKPLSWQYARLKENEAQMLNDPEVQAFKAEWDDMTKDVFITLLTEEGHTKWEARALWNARPKGIVFRAG